LSEVTCRDCVNNTATWMERRFNISVWSWQCRLTWNEPEYNPVDGSTSQGRYDSCGVARVKEKVCGKAGTAWQPRGKNNFFVYLKRI
jgi:hypothetical protein